MGYTVIVDGHRPCITCKEVKPVDEFYHHKYKTKQGKDSVRCDSICKSCTRERRLSHNKTPHALAVEQKAHKLWYEKNKEQQKEYRRERQQNPAHRANKAKSQRLRKARIRAGSNNNDPAVKEIYQLAMDTEKKLAACMECDDELEIKMHVDHIKPLCLGGKHVIENLQILSARENLLKGSRQVSAKPKEVAPHV